jgi:hypothetical protein
MEESSTTKPGSEVRATAASGISRSALTMSACAAWKFTDTTSGLSIPCGLFFHYHFLLPFGGNPDSLPQANAAPQTIERTEHL